MNHHASPRFWALYEALPSDIRDLAEKNYRLLNRDPHHPSLHFKKIGQFWMVHMPTTTRRLANGESTERLVARSTNVT